MNNSEKNLFNDDRVNNVRYKIDCCGCRSSVEMVITHYPHGLSFPNFCVTCGSETETQIKVISE